MILPALTEAVSPLFRPIKYSLFPPWAWPPWPRTSSPRMRSRSRTSTSRGSLSTTRPTSWPSRSTSRRARRAYALADHYRARGAYVVLGGLHVTSLPEEAAAHADTIFLGPGEDTWPRFLADLRAGRRARATRPSCARWPRCPHPPRPHQALALPGAELDRGLARLPALLLVLLQGGVLRGRPRVLHPARGRGAGGDRAPARPPPLLPGRSPLRRRALRERALRRHARDGPALAGRGHGSRPSSARICSRRRWPAGCAASSSASRPSTRRTCAPRQAPEPAP